MDYSEEAADTHVCLTCHATILGLDNYVSHKKTLCPGLKNRVASVPTTSTTTDMQLPAVSVDVSSEIVTTSLAEGTLSPGSRVVDPNMVLYSRNTPTAQATADIHTDPSISDFISSLELQIRGAGAGGAVAKETGTIQQEQKTPELLPKPTFSLDAMEQSQSLFDHSKSLRLSSILHDLEFSSDSEGFIPSDAEDLLNFADDEEQEEGHQRSHSGGKWRPGTHSPGKGRPSGKLLAALKSMDKAQGELGHQSPPKTGGKWKPGWKPQTLRGKWRPGETPRQTRGKWRSIGKHKSYPDEEEDEEEDNDDDEKVEQGENLEVNLDLGAEEVVVECETRPVSDNDQIMFSPGKTEDADIQPVVDKSVLGPVTKCVPCEKSFVSQKTYSRHLLSSVHKKKHKEYLKKSEKNVLTPMKSSNVKQEYECSLCAKSFNSKYNFARHLVTGFHARRAKTDPSHFLEEEQQNLLLRLRHFQCRVCSFYCNTEEPFIDHCQSDSHAKAVKQLLGPVKCVRCKYQSRENTEILEHINSEEHKLKLRETNKQCILKERRTFFKCPVCSAFKHSAPSLLAHLKLHKEKQDFVPRKRGVHTTRKCEHCDKEFRDSFNLALHIRRRHTKDRPFTCKECNVGFADNTTRKLHYKSKRHMNRLLELCDNTLPSNNKDLGHKRFKCGWCNFVTHEHKLLRPHYIAEHAKRILNCQLCSMTFKTKKGLDRHLKCSKHQMKEKEAEKDPNKEIICKVCDQKFYHLGKYQMHELQHSGLYQRDSPEASPESTVHPKFHKFLRSLKMDHPHSRTGKGGSKVPCPECDKEIGRRYIVSHLRQHSGTAPYKCVHCNKSFKDAGALQRHLRFHLSIKPFKCKHCPQEFYRQCYLTNHMFKHHKEPKVLPHACKQCTKSFPLASQLKVHVKRQHLVNSKQFACTYEGCEKKFLFKSELAIHVRIHSQDRPYLCDQCGYAGKTRNQLTRHRRRHTGEKNFHCEYCTYKAINGTNLKRHMRIHTGAKPFQCPHCEYSCNAQENIRKHIIKTKKHRGLCIYPCKLCDHRFATNSSKEFADHLTSVHHKVFKDKDLASVMAGLYKKDEDIWKVPEGEQALPLKERTKKQKKVLKEDHAYTICESVQGPGTGGEDYIGFQDSGNDMVPNLPVVPVLVMAEPGGEHLHG